MNRKFLYLLIPALFVAFIFGKNWYMQPAYDDGERAPDVTATLANGQAFQLSDLQGKYVLLDFWGSWCMPCRRENPQLVQLHATTGTQLHIVSIALEKDKTAGLNASIQDNFSWKYQIVEETALVLMSSIARDYGVTQLPTKILIDPDGRITKATTFEEIYAELEAHS